MSYLMSKAHAKINLSLDVVGKREDGYHELRTIMQEIELHDTITIEIIPSGIEIQCSDPSIPLDKSNTVYKAVSLLLGEYKINSGVKISIKKRIPVGAGLGGGSSDAATAIKMVAQLFDLPTNDAVLQKVALKTGADVPFFINGGTQLAEGIGEKLTPIPSLRPLDILLVNPGFKVSTKWVYNKLNLSEEIDHPDTELLIDAICRNEINVLAQNMKNVLETVTEKEHDIISKIKTQLLKCGALGSLMSGSGPTVFGIFTDYETAQNAFKFFDGHDYKCYLTGVRSDL